MAGSDVVVHPSHAESFGLAVLEAMAAGKRRRGRRHRRAPAAHRGRGERRARPARGRGRAQRRAGPPARRPRGARRAGGASRPRRRPARRRRHGAADSRRCGRTCSGAPRAEPPKSSLPRRAGRATSRPSQGPPHERDPSPPPDVAHVAGVERLVLAALRDGVGHPGRGPSRRCRRETVVGPRRCSAGARRCPPWSRHAPRRARDGAGRPTPRRRRRPGRRRRRATAPSTPRRATGPGPAPSRGVRPAASLVGQDVAGVPGQRTPARRGCSAPTARARGSG